MRLLVPPILISRCHYDCNAVPQGGAAPEVNGGVSSGTTCAHHQSMTVERESLGSDITAATPQQQDKSRVLPSPLQFEKELQG